METKSISIPENVGKLGALGQICFEFWSNYEDTPFFTERESAVNQIIQKAIKDADLTEEEISNLYSYNLLYKGKFKEYITLTQL